MDLSRGPRYFPFSRELQTKLSSALLRIRSLVLFSFGFTSTAWLLVLPVSNYKTYLVYHTPLCPEMQGPAGYTFTPTPKPSLHFRTEPCLVPVCSSIFFGLTTGCPHHTRARTTSPLLQRPGRSDHQAAGPIRSPDGRTRGEGGGGGGGGGGGRRRSKVKRGPAGRKQLLRSALACVFYVLSPGGR